MFDLSRRLLAGPQATRVRAFLRDAFRSDLTVSPELQRQFDLPSRIKDVSESQLMLLLQHNATYLPMLDQYLSEMSKLKPGTTKEEQARKVWRGRFRGLLQTQLSEDFKKLNDPLEPMRLDSPGGAPGYRHAQVFIDHPGYRDGKWLPPQDLVKVVLDFINGARQGLMLNVFDFDLMEVADALVAKAGHGVPVMVGIDKRVIAERPEVKAVFDKLKGAQNVTAVAVDAVGLNHQKMIVRDWNDPKLAKVLLSSGNLTRSCLSPGGDLAGAASRPKNAVPNANHMITLDSYPAAQAVADSLIKTLQYRLRGNAYPLGGAFQVSGGGAVASTDTFMALAFSPRGGLGEVNRDIVRRVLLQTRGPIRMMQFAFSSDEVVAALLERAKLEKSEGRAFDFQSVGDTPFAVSGWSGFLKLSGYELKESAKGKRYVPLKKNPLRDLLGAGAYAKLKADIHVAPPEYGKHTMQTAKGAIEYDAKLHHKVLISGDVVIAGTSFNISENAEGNNEQMIVFRDPDVVRDMTAAFEGLFRESHASVEDEVRRRNAHRSGSNDASDDEDGAGPAKKP